MKRGKSLKEINNLIKEAEFLYQQYIANENMPDYSVPILKAAEVCMCLCENILIAAGVNIQNGYVILNKNTKDKKNRKTLIAFLLEQKEIKITEENRRFLQIIQIYKKKAKRAEHISRGELYEFFRAYKCFLSTFFTTTGSSILGKEDEEGKKYLLEYIEKILIEMDVPRAITTSKQIGFLSTASAAMALMGGPLTLIPALAVTGIGIGKGIRKKKIDNIGKEMASVSGVIKNNEELKNLGGGVMEIGGAAVVEENKKQSAESSDSLNTEKLKVDGVNVQQLMDFIKEQMQESTSKMEAVIKDSSKEITVKLDNMAQILQDLKNQIESYQALVQNQIDIAVTADEVDRILHVYSETCVNKIVSEIDKKYSNKTRIEEEQKLKASLGENVWNKLSPESKNYLVSAKVTYNYYTNIESLDYSGVCLLVTKALEVEMSNRFYRDFVLFLKTGYTDSWKRHMDDFPTTLIKTVNGARVLKTAKEFTLGAVPYVLCAAPDIKASEEQQKVNKRRVLEYAKEKLFESELSDEEIWDKLIYYGESIEDITKNYRNKAAHTNELKKVDAESCFEIVIDVEQLLKKILESFKY